jgi:hypothetical protein
VLHDGKSFAVRSGVGRGDAGGDASGRTPNDVEVASRPNGRKAIEDGGRSDAGFGPFARLQRVVGGAELGGPSAWRGRAARREIRTELEPDDERDRQRQKSRAKLPEKPFSHLELTSS